MRRWGCPVWCVLLLQGCALPLEVRFVNRVEPGPAAAAWMQQVRERVNDHEARLERLERRCGARDRADAGRRTEEVRDE